MGAALNRRTTSMRAPRCARERKVCRLFRGQRELAALSVSLSVIAERVALPWSGGGVS